MTIYDFAIYVVLGAIIWRITNGVINGMLMLFCKVLSKIRWAIQTVLHNLYTNIGNAILLLIAKEKPSK